MTSECSPETSVHKPIQAERKGLEMAPLSRAQRPETPGEDLGTNGAGPTLGPEAPCKSWEIIHRPGPGPSQNPKWHGLLTPLRETPAL